MTKILLLLSSFLTILSALALGNPPPGADPDSPIYKWFDRQYNVLGKSCCGQGDGHTLEDYQWRTKHSELGDDYEVNIDGKWLRVPHSEYLRDVLTDPNPTDHATIWYTLDTTEPEGIKIWCFGPGHMI